MPELSTLAYVADLIIRKALTDAGPDTDIAKTIEEAYPFDNTQAARRIWLDALIRYSMGRSREDKSTAA
jgi:hypothetical protein